MKVLYTFYYKDSYWENFWKNYYAPFFDTTITHELDPNGKVDDYHISAVYNSELHNLLIGGNLVMHVDIDEIVVPDPENYKDLGDYMDKFTGEAVCATAYNLMEMEGDKPLDNTKKLTDQRRYWSRDGKYDKAVFTRKKLKYSPGFHYTIEQVPRDEDLVMFHLRDANLKEASDIFHKHRITEFSIGEFQKRRDEAVEIPEKWRVI